jgi:hypothetical protein
VLARADEGMESLFVCRSLCRFLDAGMTNVPRPVAAGVQKAPRHEVAGNWALAVQRVLWGAATVWRTTAGCRDVTLPASGAACAPVLALRQAQATAERRDVIDADLREAESQLRLLPSVMASYPQADTAARLISWMSFA